MQRKSWSRDLTTLSAVLCLIAFPLAGCDDDDDPIVPSPDDEEGMVALEVSDATTEPDPVIAEFQADARLQLFADGDWLDVTGITDTDIVLDVHEEQQPIDSASVEARTYEQARVVLTNVSIVVAAGSEINGTPIADETTVVVAGGDEVIVTYAVPIVVEEDETVRLVLTLNSATWLTPDAVAGEAVTAADFEAAASLTVVTAP